MDRRSWPWKKLSCNKIKSTTHKPVAALETVGTSLSSLASLGDQENYKKVNYVQITMDAYSHLNGLEDQVNTLKNQVKLSEDEAKKLQEKLYAAHSEINNKDSLIKQHVKVAEEAVSGWEKADAEALALKSKLESVTLSKLTVEDRADHLDIALKECMRQIRNVKEESELKLQEVLFAKTRQWDKIKLELEAQIVELDQRILSGAAENAALSKSLQEQSNLIVKINEEKFQFQAEIEYLNEKIQSCKQESSSLKYELRIASKELDIRNEEKNISMRSAEVANKQHLEGVKKIAKLEAECQRLHNLVRKKLPGTAALAQMKLELENLERVNTERRIQRTTVKNHSLHLSPMTEVSTKDLHQSPKEIEFLTARLSAMEEETKMLKEALATRNSELQASRNLCAKTLGRFKSLEAQIQACNQRRSSPTSNLGVFTEVSLSQYESNPPSITSMSEDGIDEEGSSAESWAPVLSDISQLKRDKGIDKSNKPQKANNLELMDDFLEMERLACLSNDANGAVTISSDPGDARNNNTEDKTSVNANKEVAFPFEHLPRLVLSPKLDYFIVNSSTIELEPNPSLLKLQSRILMILKSQTKVIDSEKILEEIKCAMEEEIQDSMAQRSISHLSNQIQSDDSFYSGNNGSQYMGETTVCEISLAQDGKPGCSMENTTKQDLATAISLIHQFVLSLSREAMRVHDPSAEGHGLSKNIEEFSASVDKLILNKISSIDFVLELSHVLAKLDETNFYAQGFRVYNRDVNVCDYVDKIAFLENETIPNDSSKQAFNHRYYQSSNPGSGPKAQDNIVSPASGSDFSSCDSSLKELEQLKFEKDTLVVDIARCVQHLENTKLQLEEMEELKSQLASSQKQYILVETQLKCITESYKSLELYAQELEAEVNPLREKAEKLNNEPLEARYHYEDAFACFKDLPDKVQRNKNCSISSSSSLANFDMKAKQETEIAAATGKLAECQKTIYLLGKQLEALRPQIDMTGSQYSEGVECSENLVDDKAHSSQS
ncbi:DUF869 domain-containing protein [Cephalotus follicularis]|uniref:DUF869 domain-containing protein n=1 Tax=Cephalotus follicularis TaxID=3775 RepID=A0A1Q3C2L0_CEPFO|nr:DUF869 domain-containing protein [Cephalotus follicularis]